MIRKVIVLITVLVNTFLAMDAQGILRCRVIDAKTGEPLAGSVIRTSDKNSTSAVVTDADGYFSLKVNEGTPIRITYIGYTDMHDKFQYGRVYKMTQAAGNLQDVVVTASESTGLTSSSKIGQHAMQHLQPSSFSDLLELLPGGMAQDPVLNTPNTIDLRDIPLAGSQYNTSSLGTSFVIDGAPISTNANMQYLDGASDTQATSRDFTNAGVDMRSISTDDIQNVEIVRGIPSVEYGDLTSGLVKITRKKGGNDISARFKADMDSKLFYLAKGFEWKPQKLSLNLSADYLDSKADPRNILETYNRVTLSARLNKLWIRNKLDYALNVNLDYGGSFDGDKVDPELNYGGVDKYKSGYNRYALSGSLDIINHDRASWFKAASALVSASYEKDIITRTRLVQLDRDTPAATSTKDGEGDAVLIQPYTYTATQKVDGRPFSGFVKMNATFGIPSRTVSNSLKVGADWLIDKNYGKGQIFDTLNPLYPGISERPRKYSVVPASHNLSEYLEEDASMNIGKNKFEISAGVRNTTMLNLPGNYLLHGKFYLDPRINAGWTFPSFRIGSKAMTIQLSGGYGQQTKTPTMDQLYPEPVYMDLIELNYYHPKKEYRRIYLQTYVIDPTNKDLEAARNTKWELRGDFHYAGNRLTVTYFREDMKSGFRTTETYKPYTYKTFDTSGIDAKTLTAPPDVNTLPYTENEELRGYGITTNGSRTLKRGVEYTFSTARVPVINTRLTVSGAWFKTEYRNSQPVMEKPTVVVGGKTYKYVGIYSDDDGYIREMSNTNFTFDTDIPKLKLGFSVSAQCLWMTGSQSMEKENVPISYMDEKGVTHEFTAADKTDSYLQYLVRTYNASMFAWQTIPFSMNVNLKATKALFGDKLLIALFVNKLWDSHSDYDRNNFTIRRHVTPYFGLEMNVKI